MAHLTRLAAPLVAVILAACAATTPTPKADPSVAPQTAAPTSAPRTIHVLEDPIEFAFLPVPPNANCTTKTGCIGEQLVGHSRLLDATTKDVVGTFLVDCRLLDPVARLFLCPGNVLNLTGRGQIVFTEDFRFTAGVVQEPFAILGGTGEFLGITGSIDSPSDSTWQYADFVITIRQ